MKPERWDEIENLCQRALDLDPAERAAFLDRECGGDEWLRKKVEHYLAFESQAEDFIETPPGDIAAAAVAAESSVPAVEKSQPPPAKPAKSWFFRAVWVVGCVLAGYFVFAGVMLYRHGFTRLETGWDAVRKNEGWAVSRVDPQGPAAGKLHVGDRITTIDDDPRFNVLGLGYLHRVKPFGGDYRVRVPRDGTSLEITLRAEPVRDVTWLPPVLVQLVLAASFFGIGMMIGTLKPDERTTRLACAAMLAAVVLFLRNALGTAYFLQGMNWAIWFPVRSIMGLPLALTYHFFQCFPPTVPSGKFWTACRYVLYGWSLLSTAWLAANNIERFLDEPAQLAFFNLTHQGWSVYTPVYVMMQVTALTLTCAVSYRNYRLAAERDRRRIKWMVYGVLIGLLPVVGHSLADVYLTFTTRTDLRWVGALINLTTIAVPVSFAYAILKYRVFDIGVVVRLGLRYLLAKNVLRVMMALPVIGLSAGVLMNPHRTVAELLVQNRLYSGLFVLTALSLRFRKPLGNWIDRRFFREAYDGEQILLGLIDEIAELDSPAELARQASRKIDAALHPKRIHVFHRDADGRDLTLGYSSGAAERILNLPETARLLQVLEGKSGVHDFPFPPAVKLPVKEQAWLAGLEVSLIVPMKEPHGALVGILLLGEKKSEQPYTPTDRRLLSAVARQMATAHQIEWLKGKVDKETTVNRAVLARLDPNRFNLLKECPACGACYDSSAEVCAEDNRELILTLPIERTVDDQYRLERLLGKGGMGAVYEATDLRLDRRVAVKIMAGGALGQTARRRFDREARASARLSHPNIVTVHSFGSLGNEGAYLVMEFLHGRTLREELKQRRRLDPPTAAEWIGQLLDGLVAAHEAGVIHRDLKPENVFLAQRGNGNSTVKILDFGLAKFRSVNTTEPSSLTTPGMVMGTFGYMSPEQLTGGETDERGDIFSAGILIVEILTGSRPFEGRNYTELLNSVLHDEFHLKGDAPAVKRLETVLGKCLAKVPKQRFATAAALKTAVVPAIRECSLFPEPPVPIDEKNTDSLL